MDFYNAIRTPHSHFSCLLNMQVRDFGLLYGVKRNATAFRTEIVHTESAGSPVATCRQVIKHTNAHNFGANLPIVFARTDLGG